MKIKKTAKQKTKLVLSTLTAAAIAVPAIGFAGYCLTQSRDSHADSKSPTIFTAGEDGIGELSSPVAAVQVAAPARYTDANTAQVAASFDDPNFYTCVNDTYREMTGSDLPKDDKAMTEALESIEYLNCSNRQIENVMPAFMYMRNLVEVDLSNNEIWDFSMPAGNQQNLRMLNIAGNHLNEGSFNFQANNNLTDLNLSYNQFKVIDRDYIIWRTVRNLDVSGNENLEYVNLVLNYENLNSFKAAGTKLKLSGEDYSKYGQRLTELDLSNTRVEKFYAELPSLLKLNLSNTELVDMKISRNESLQELDVSNNQLSELDITQWADLLELDASSNNLEYIDWSYSPNIESLYIYNNQLSSIDVSNLANLRELNVGQNQLTSIDISHNPNLVMFANYENQISEVDLSQNTQLQQVGIWKNNIETVDLSNNPAVELLVADDVLVHTNIVTDQATGAKDFDLNGLKFIGARGGSKVNQNKAPIPMTTFAPSEFYTWDAQNKILSVNNLEGTQGYAQVIPDPNIPPVLAEYADYLKYRLQLTDGTTPPTPPTPPVPHTDGGGENSAAAAPNTGIGDNANQSNNIMTAIAIAAPALIASILTAFGIRRYKRGSIKLK